MLWINNKYNDILPDYYFMSLCLYFIQGYSVNISLYMLHIVQILKGPFPLVQENNIQRLGLNPDKYSLLKKE